MCGIVGRNGAGKSTLLRLLGGVSVPDEGTMTVHGRVGGLLELTAGFHGDLTGRENVMVGGVIRGLRRTTVRSRFSSIVEFAELAAVIDHPLRTYSTGMQMRLAFAVAIHCEPEVLLVDEVLAVGDFAFQQKCLEATSRLRAQGAAIVVVSHDLSTVATMCDQAIYLRGGQVVAAGAASTIVEQYQNSVWAETVRLTPAAELLAAGSGTTLAVGETRFGSMEAVVEDVQLTWLEADDRHRDTRLRITMTCLSDHAIEGAIVGLTIVHQDGRVCYDINTEAARITVPTLDRRLALSVEIAGMSLEPGRYHVDIGLYERGWNHAYDYHSLAYPLVVEGAIGGASRFESWRAVWAIEPASTSSAHVLASGGSDSAHDG
jgi:lipopolysaccharide transport system ATP-binding protein